MRAIRIPATKFPIVRWLGEADDEPDRGRAREDAAGDRSHLRDLEQRGEDADEDDRADDRPAQHAVARDRLGRQAAAGDPPVDELGRDRRWRTTTTTATISLCQKSDTPRYSPQSIGFRPAKPSARSCQYADRRPRRPASRAGPPRLRAATGSRGGRCPGPSAARRGRVEAPHAVVELAASSVNSSRAAFRSPAAWPPPLPPIACTSPRCVASSSRSRARTATSRSATRPHVRKGAVSLGGSEQAGRHRLRQS